MDETILLCSPNIWSMLNGQAWLTWICIIWLRALRKTWFMVPQCSKMPRFIITSICSHFQAALYLCTVLMVQALSFCHVCEGLHLYIILMQCAYANRIAICHEAFRCLTFYQSITLPGDDPAPCDAGQSASTVLNIKLAMSLHNVFGY